MADEFDYAYYADQSPADWAPEHSYQGYSEDPGGEARPLSVGGALVGALLAPISLASDLVDALGMRSTRHVTYFDSIFQHPQDLYKR